MLNAASSMKTYGDAAVKRLIQALQDQNRETRWKAAVALGEVGTPAVEPLISVVSQGMDGGGSLTADRRPEGDQRSERCARE